MDFELAIRADWVMQVTHITKRLENGMTSKALRADPFDRPVAAVAIYWQLQASTSPPLSPALPKINLALSNPWYLAAPKSIQITRTRYLLRHLTIIGLLLLKPVIFNALFVTSLVRFVLPPRKQVSFNWVAWNFLNLSFAKLNFAVYYGVRLEYLQLESLRPVWAQVFRESDKRQWH